MNLIIIEGVGKLESIKKYLGSGWEVFATRGHVRDLPVKSLGINMYNNFAPEYEIMEDKKQVIKQLKEKAAKSDLVLLATDPDREGEAISWHIAHVLNYDADKPCRIVFNEISKDAVTNAIKSPRVIDKNLVDAQQARRVLDRLVGYKISPILCKKVKNNLSAGRVQSVALKLIVDRENEILNFKPEEYWTLSAELEKPNNKPLFKADFHSYKGKKIKVKKEAEMQEVLTALENANYVITDIKKTVSKSHAPAPFITSTMQQDADSKLGMTLKKVTACAQELYEGVTLGNEGKVALVTYIRTDSTRVSESAVKMAKDYIINKYGKEYYPSRPNVYKAKGLVQDAHEAIRPISLDRTPESVKPYISNDNYKLYKLIYDRFVASQMSEALYDSVSCKIDANDYTFKATGKAIKFMGYTAAYKAEKVEKGKDEIKLPPLENGDTLNLIALKPEQKFTKPPARYTEGTIVEAMKDKGIGRPATYAQTITTILSRKYIEKNGKQILPTELGFMVNEFLSKYFAQVINVDFTAQMESRLDGIEEGGKVWQDVIKDFYLGFQKELRNANLEGEKVVKPVVVSDVKCDKCGAFLVEKDGKYGKFLACPNYPKCKNIVSLTPKKQPVAKCPNCGKNVFLNKSKKGTVYYSCEDYKNCKFMSWDLPLEEKCPNCNSFLMKKENKKGGMIKCSNCDYTKPLENGEKIEKD